MGKTRVTKETGNALWQFNMMWTVLDGVGIIPRCTTYWANIFPQNRAYNFTPGIFHHMCCIELFSLLVFTTECTESSLFKADTSFVEIPVCPWHRTCNNIQILKEYRMLSVSTIWIPWVNIFRDWGTIRSRTAWVRKSTINAKIVSSVFQLWHRGRSK